MHKLSYLALFLAAACGDDATPAPDAGAQTTPTTFSVQVDNIAPWTVLESGAQPVHVDGTSGPIGPGGAFEVTFSGGKGQSVSFASMFGETNDWFFAPGPTGISLYDANGAPVTGDVTSQVSLWNAGTEVDQEPGVGPDTGPHQSSPDQGAADPDPTVRMISNPVILSDGSSFTRPEVADMIRVTLTPGANRSFTLRVENVSTDTTLQTSAGARAIHVSPPLWAVHGAPAPFFTPGMPDRAQGLEHIAEAGDFSMLQSEIHELTGWPTPISPGVYAIHTGSEPLYALGLPDRGQGLEHLAEDGNNTAFLASMTATAGLTAGSFDIPVGATAKGPAAPGAGYQFSISAMPGDRLSFATMFGMSDDWIFATNPDGIALFDASGAPASGDVTPSINIYDVGTEIDELPAIGPDTGPQQPAPDTGAADPVVQVRQVSTYTVPATAHLRVTLTPQ
ncbi:MAG TPA: spondin domain-containing protein [Kofleriaceae bacterium]|jgi:hypothetical protein